MPPASPLLLDVEISAAEIAGLASADALTGFFTRLGYDSSTRTAQTAANLGITAEGTGKQIRRVEQVASCDGDLHVLLFEVESLNQALTRALVRRLKDLAGDYLLVLTDGWDRLDFVLVEREIAGRSSAVGVAPVSVVARVLSVERRKPSTVDLRVLRRFSRTEADRFLQFDKLRSAFSVAYWSEELFNNRALFSDHYLTDAERLRDLPEWSEDPKADWLSVRQIFQGAAARWAGKPESVVRTELFEPLLQCLGWGFRPGKRAGSEEVEPDYVLAGPRADAKGKAFAVCLAYPWGRFLDGKDPQRDKESPEENPTAVVVSLLERGDAPWAIVTNGKLWRLYSARAHSRATNFYEIDLEETLAFSGPQATDPAEAFRYFWLFFRRSAFEAVPDPDNEEPRASFVDRVLADSEEYAKELGERLKTDIFEEVFPHLSKGFLEGIREREGLAPAELPDERLDAVYRATLTLLYRLLFLLYAEARDLLPVRATRAYRDLSLADLKRKIAEVAGTLADDRDERMAKAFRTDRHEIYDRLKRLFRAIDEGDASLNVPVYNGGLFVTQSAKDDPSPDAEAARFLARHAVPDRHMAAALDRLCRGIDTRRQDLVQVDYKSLGVRQLGSIYEGLLEFRLRVAPERLAIVRKSGKDIYEPTRGLDERTRDRAERQGRILKKGEVYLENDKRERKATGSYYTPDHIVRYIVEQAVGPVLAERFDALRPKLRRAQKERADFLKRREADQKRGVRPEPVEKADIFGQAVAEELFDVRVLDPAMGSGHFLVEAVDFITDRMLAFLNSFRPWHPVVARLEETRREILREAEKQEVSIDREKLTDVNLLKRHVLKRCIFGVDLNPMAVELAKVSLWLDAFTLGAPLSFLDHHLRCGNSLVGVTVAEVETEVKGEENLLLFGGRFDRLVGATDMMRRVGGLSDVTSAQVRESRDQYRNASDLLAPFKRMLDVYTAGLFRPSAAGPRRTASAFETRPEIALLSSHEADPFFDAPTAADAEKAIRKLPARLRDTATDASRTASEHRFFHWELEFPEVFYGPRPGTTQVIERLADAGFDAVIGNPPYVRMELIKPIKPFLKPRYACHDERADLFIYFYEKAVDLLRPEGLTSYIASITWTKTNAGTRLRDLLKATTTVGSFVDFGDLPIFQEATTYSCVMVVKKALAAEDHVVRSLVVNDIEEVDLTDRLNDSSIVVPQTELQTMAWHFEDRRLARLREKIQSAGVPLKEYCDGRILRGIVTGLNRAFVVDTATRDRLVREDQRSAEILKPFLEGRKDLRAWHAESRGLFLIYAFHGVEIQRYPAVLEYLRPHRKALERRATSASHKWYELQQPQMAYKEFFEKPKVVWPELSEAPTFSIQPGGTFFNNKVYFVPGDDPYLLAILSSPPLWLSLTGIAREMRGGYFELFSQVVEKLPIPPKNSPDAGRAAALAQQISCSDGADFDAIEQLKSTTCRLYGLTADEEQLLRDRTSGRR